MSTCVKEPGGGEKFDKNKSNKVNTRSNTRNKAGVMEDKDKQNNRKMNNKQHHKHSRKRSQPMPGSKCHKRRRIDYTRRFIPPTKFLLGGNIHDPLNLNSLQDEEINRAMNAVTPKSSPLPTPQHRKGGEIEVIIPPNICDPLNLAQCDDENTADYEAQLILPPKKLKRTKKKRKKSGCTTDEAHFSELGKTSTANEDNKTSEDIMNTAISAVVSETSGPPVPIIEPATPDEEAQTRAPTESTTTPPKKLLRKESLNHSLELKIQRRMDSKDKIVSPVVPQPTHRVVNSRFRQLTPTIAKGQKTPNFREKNCKFQYGNYNKYYGYRNLNQEVDPRIKILSKFRHVFHKRDVLDIGCNIGHVTLTVARDFNANSIVGLDIDKHLIKVARTNIKHYVNCKNSPLDDPETGHSIERPTVTPTYSAPGESTERSTGTPTSTAPGDSIERPTVAVPSLSNSSPATSAIKTLAMSQPEEVDGFKKPFSPAVSRPELNRVSPGHKAGIKQELKLETPGVEIKQEAEDNLEQNPDVFFPISMPIVYGGIDIPGIPSKLSKQFPHNVSFVQGNYVLDSDVLLEMEQAQFDVILCLSVTKWFHLNFGDAGLKRVFKRMYAQLREGGVLILEPQGWSSYRKKKKLTDTIWRNYQSVEFFPHHFTQYLLAEIGFTKCETLGSPFHSSKGFQRPIKMFTKGVAGSTVGKDVKRAGEWT